MAKKHTVAVILAAGSGRRMSDTETKQRITICGKTVLRRAAEAFNSASRVDDIIVAVRDDELEFASSELSGLSKIRSIIVGGETRCASARLAALSLPSDFNGVIMIHDAARCLITPGDINAVADAAYKHGCATASLPVVDTVKVLDGDGFIASTSDRARLRLASTPQAFDFKLYRKALDECSFDDVSVTDDNYLLEAIGERIYPVCTSPTNIKITTASDLLYAKFLLERSADVL